MKMKSKVVSTLYIQDLSDQNIDGLAHAYLESLAQNEDSKVQGKLLKKLVKEYVALEKQVDALLKNTLPTAVAEEIKRRGKFPPRECDCSILFTDIAGFTKLAEKISGPQLVEALDRIFTGFDEMAAGFQGTKIKTIGDSYMAVFGAPAPLERHAALAVESAWAMQEFLRKFNESDPDRPPLSVRIGIHSGKVMAGVVGIERMQFDVFGDNVNIASRFESSGSPGRINVSEQTRMLCESGFAFEDRGLVPLKNKESMRAYFVVGKR